jgi:hypothetical protein
MKLRTLAILSALLVPVLLGAQQPGAPSGNDLGTSDVLRGYGKVKVTSDTGTSGWGWWKRDYRLWHFEATSPENASTVTGKFLADLNLSPEVIVGTMDINGKSFPLVTVPGGSTYTGYVSGNIGCVIASSDDAGLKSYLSSSSEASGAVVTDFKYPNYLDRFDRHGWGFYGFNSNFGASTGRNKVTDPLDDMDFLGKNDFRFEIWPQPVNFDDAYGTPERKGMDWLLTEAQKHNVPVSARLYGNLPHTKEFSDVRDVMQPFMEGGWYWSILGYRSYPRQSWFNPEGRLYMARQAQDEIKLYADHPEIESWMLPYGEVGTYDWYVYHGDISPAALNDWHDTIQNKQHLSLDELSAMYNRKDHPFKSYDEIPIPEIATFDGLPGLVQDLEGQWSVRPESHPGEGLDGQWWAADVKTWDKMHMPGSVFWFRYTKGNDDQPKWVVRDFNYSGDKAAGKTVYLYDFARAVNNDPRKKGLVYLNGQKVGEPGNWGVWDVTKLLKAGANRLALQTDIFGGRVFLSTEAPALYPYLGADRNKLWILFNEWLIDGRFDACKIMLAGMREVEPNKPIKIMAPPSDDNDRWLDMAARYGAWGHFTGEGQWAYFWYKRYGFLYGLPGTSEGAGPSDDIESQFMLVQRTFLEGLNGHDQVFEVQHVTGLPVLKQWYEDHMALLKQMGRYDIAGPQVILYRAMSQAAHLMPAPSPSLGGDTHEIQSVWNWDFGRGSFQEAGLSGLYVDNGGIASGKIANYPVMIDDGNEIMTPEAINNIKDWVSKGGTFVTLPFTGRSEPSAPDSWPIQALTGCQIKTVRTPGPGKGTITIAQDQPLFKELAGKSFPDAGSSMDWQDFEHNLISTELTPGADCQVVATFENGTPAIVVHKLGAGRVIALGSAFWRHAHDVKGLWWTDELESTFFRDLLNGIGQPTSNSTTDYKVVTQRYRTNNGLDDVIVMENFADADRTVDLHVTLDAKPEKVYQVAMNTIHEVPFTVDGTTVTVPALAIPKEEVQVYYFRAHDDGNAVAHWWQYQQKLWKPTDPVKLDFSSVSKGRWIDPTLDLKGDWHWTQDAPVSDVWQQTGFDDQKWSTWSLDVFNAVGADPTKPLFARKEFEVNSDWLKDGGITKLTAAGWAYDFSAAGTPWELRLNGQLLKKDGFFNPDVSSLLHEGKNILTINLGAPKNGKYIGVIGSIYLSHAKAPAKVIKLDGTWTSTLNGKPVLLQFPGKGTAFAPTRSIDVPAEWKDQYIVTYYAKGARESTIGAIVNETGVIRRFHHLFGNEVEVDITPYLHFGQPNSLTMLSTSGQSLPESVNWDLEKVELHLYPKADYR